MPAITTAGRYRGEAVSLGLRRTETKSLSLNIDWLPSEKFDEETGKWQPWLNPDGATVQGDIWFRGRDGRFNARQITTLRDVLKWTSGDVTDFEDRTKFWPPHCQFVVEKDEYKGTVRFKVAWVNSWDSTGGNVRAQKSEYQEMKDELGDSLKAALAGETPKPAELNDNDEVPF